MSAGTCDAEDAPNLPGRIRVTLIDDSGEGDTAYLDPDTLPELMRKFDRHKDVRGRTYRALAGDIESWARLRALAIRGRKTCPEPSLLLLVWLYLRHPQNLNLAERMHELLTEHGHACLMIVFHRRTQNVVAVAAPGFDGETLERLTALVATELPEGTSFVKAPAGAGRRPC